MTVLITGVAGRIGSNLAQQLVCRGYDVRGMVRPGGRSLDASLSSTVEVVEASLTDADALARAVSGVDVVVHLATQMVLGETLVDRFFDINVLGTQRLLEAAVHQDKPVRRFLLASTDGTYGPADPHTEVISEEHPQLPGDYYGTAKVLCEQLVRNYGKLRGLEYSILRFGSVVTPEEAASLFTLGWVRAFLAQAHIGRRGSLWQLFTDCADPVAIVDSAVGRREDNPATVLTGPDGSPWSLHLTDVRDAVAGTVLAMEHPGAANEDFNIVAARTTTFADGASVVSERFDVETVSVELPMKLAFELSTAKAHHVLDYRPKWDFHGMVDTALAGPSADASDYVPVAQA